MVPERQLLQKPRSKGPFWTFSNHGKKRHTLHRRQQRGWNNTRYRLWMGPDSMVGKLVELEAKQRGVPYVLISLDEHTGEAGVLQGWKPCGHVRTGGRIMRLLFPIWAPRPLRSKCFENWAMSRYAVKAKREYPSLAPITRRSSPAYPSRYCWAPTWRPFRGARR